MTKNRTNFIYKLQGKIFTRRLAQSPLQSKYSGQPYYVLTILQPNKTKKSIQVFRSKLSQDEIWTSIEQKQCLGSHYIFFCRNQKGYFYLVDWEKKPTPAPKENNHDLN